VNFGEGVASAKTRPAPRTITLDPNDFADEYGGRPVAPVVFGLRVPSEADVQAARNEATKTCVQFEDKETSTATFNDTLMAVLVARGICSVHDVTKPHPFLELADDMVPLALKSRTITRIYDSLERLHVEQSPLYPEADADDLVALRSLLDGGALEKIDRSKQGNVRRYLRYCLDMMRPNG
jgi:hypothetical protein